MTRSEAEDFVYESYLRAQAHQSYEARDSEKRRPDLTQDLLRSKSVTPCVVITGSKGKGSVAVMISQIMQVWHRVGLMTSPHLESFCERFCVDGVPVSDEAFAGFMTQIEPGIRAIMNAENGEETCVSPMGIQADFALTYFQAEGTSFNVFECGKGAKYDDVNNIKHDYAIINDIFLEHVRELGGTLEEIAADKACVITGEQKFVYVAEQKPEVLSVIRERAKQFGTPLKIYGEDFWAENVRFSRRGMRFDVRLGDEEIRDVAVPLLGEHQARNCALALALCRDASRDMARTSNAEDVPKEPFTDDEKDLIRESLQRLRWPGRMEILSSEPLVLLDACINAKQCQNVIDVMKKLGMEQAVVVIGIPDDKDYEGVVFKMMPVAKEILLTKSQNPHYVFTKGQQENLSKKGVETIWTNSVEEAIAKAKGLNAQIVILGTTSVVSEVEAYFHKSLP